MKKNKIITWIVIALIITGISFLTYQYYFKEDSKSTLTLVEKQWIESNKNKIIDLGIENDLAIFTKDGNGVMFDFLKSLETDTNLEFNKIPFNKGENSNADYVFKAVSKKAKNDILVYQDNYALLTNNKKTYYNLSDIRDLNIGVLKSDLKSVDYYLSADNNLSYQTFDDVQSLLGAIKDPKKGIDAIALPKMYYLTEIITNGNLNISYNINEMTKDYVISLGKTNKLNTIIKKYYKKWSVDNFTESFSNNFSANYFDSRQVDEAGISKFKSKRYIYGFVSHKPYQVNLEGKLYGFNIKQLDKFATMSNIEIDYKEYENLKDLQTAFNTNKIDLFYDNVKDTKYSLDTVKTTAVSEALVAVISPLNNSVAINSLNSLKDMEVSSILDSKISAYLKKASANVHDYKNTSDLIQNRKDNDILVIDYNTYEFYKHNELSNYKIDYVGNIGANGYLIRDIKDNKIFSDYLNFYLSVINTKNNCNESIYTLLQIGNKPTILKNMFIILSLVGLSFVGYWLFNLYKKYKNKIVPISKIDKLRYIDALTSLKNRAYLNDNIELWDNSEVYPQTIIIVDLNNITYINDNYGHQEGDSIIKEAANKLITTQIENSDIIRTNGNEFLVYLVGYDEKQVITYIKKLSKEFKDLSHGYGAAIGYSMINDAIKTIDDAVNEATIDMRTNKEELNN